jgi:hypothetical protein
MSAIYVSEHDETQTQIIGAGLPLDDMPPYQISANGHIHVCLCNNTPNGHTLQYGWEQCPLHDAVKLASMKGKDVLLHVRNERGEIVPLRGEA